MKAAPLPLLYEPITNRIVSEMLSPVAGYVHISQPHRISRRLSTSDTILFVTYLAGSYQRFGSPLAGNSA